MRLFFTLADPRFGRHIMATYDYRCGWCLIIREEKHGMMEEPEIICNECLGTMKKYIGPDSGAIQKYGDAESMSDWEEIKNRPR